MRRLMPKATASSFGKKYSLKGYSDGALASIAQLDMDMGWRVVAQIPSVPERY